MQCLEYLFPVLEAIQIKFHYIYANNPDLCRVVSVFKVVIWLHQDENFQLFVPPFFFVFDLDVLLLGILEFSCSILE